MGHKIELRVDYCSWIVSKLVISNWMAHYWMAHYWMARYWSEFVNLFVICQWEEQLRTAVNIYSINQNYDKI